MVAEPIITQRVRPDVTIRLSTGTVADGSEAVRIQFDPFLLEDASQQHVYGIDRILGREMFVAGRVHEAAAANGVRKLPSLRA